MSKPICFVIMPFRKKKTYSSNEDFPEEIDFDALWNKVYFPLLSKSYDPVRADQDLGALIIKEMIERLVISDLVLADVTIPNANVYYELGIRHAAKRNMTVMLAAEGSKQLFDIDQMPQLRYPIEDGSITDSTAEKIAAVVEKGIASLKEGESPVYQSVAGYPNDIKVASAKSFKAFTRTLFDFQARLREVAFYDDPKPQLDQIVEDYKDLADANLGVAMQILYTIRDRGQWSDVLSFIDQMRPTFQEHPKVREIRFLSQAKSGEKSDVIKALTGLEALIRSEGATSERHGLIGGRFRSLYRAAEDDKKKAKFLDKAIEHYQKGMFLDLNEYYPSCNLPRLYRRRNQPGDMNLAEEAAIITKLACRRAALVDPEDPWLYPTLIGAAFDEGDIEDARSLLTEIKGGDPVKWKIQTTLETVEMSIELHEDEVVKENLLSLFDELKSLIE